MFLTQQMDVFFQISESDPIEVSIGDATPLSFLEGADWPESLHECPLPDGVLPEGEVVVRVKVQHMEAAVTLKGTVGIKSLTFLLC